MRPVLNTLTVSPYDRRHRQLVLELLFYSRRTHTHLDWHETSDWLDTQTAPVLLAWWNDRLVGVMAASSPFNDTCWIRLAGVADGVNATPVLATLWSDLKSTLAASGVQTVWMLVVSDWLPDHLETLGFSYFEDVVTLRRDSPILPEPSLAQVSIRTAVIGDMEIVAHVDQAAFAPPWQLTVGELRQAYRLAASCTVAIDGEQIVGYQLSTHYRASGHLARLAVAPGMQGKGVGAGLLDDLLARFLRRGVQTVTVNTQASNLNSQRLYARYQFHRNGYDLPVWVYRMD